MNLAFGTILVFLILLPGVLFRLFYYSAPFSKRFFKSNLLDDVAWSVIPGILIQFLGVSVILHFTPYKIDFGSLAILLVGKSEEAAHYIRAMGGIENHLGQIILYNFSLWIFSSLAGEGCKRVVRWLDLDKKYQLFRFDNEWYYILSGEILEFPGIVGELSDVDFVFIDVLVKDSSQSIIYTGLLQEYFLNKDGGLESICISNVKRRKLANDPRPDEVKGKEQDERYYSIPGNFMIIPSASMVNLNVRYYNLEALMGQADTEGRKTESEAGQIEINL